MRGAAAMTTCTGHYAVLHTQEVTGSSPAVSTTRKTLESQWFRGFFFAFFWKKRASLLAVFWGIFGQFRGFLLQKCCKFFRSSIRCATRVCGFLGRVVYCKLFRQLPCRMPAGPSPQFAAPDFYDHSEYKHSASCPSCCVQPNTGSPLRPTQLQKDG